MKIYRDRLKEIIEKKTSWGKNVLLQIINDEYIRTLEEIVNEKEN